MERKVFKYHHLLILFHFLWYNIHLHAQDALFRKWTISANAEVYYNYHIFYPNKVNDTPFFVSYNQNNLLDINLLNMNVQYTSTQFRFEISPMYGSYARFNMADEPAPLNFIDRLNAGIKLSSQQKLWLDVGILPSHIGFESNYGHENWLASRMITSDNTPYYETGARIQYITNNNKWLMNLNLLSGWQNITYLFNLQAPAFGHQIQYFPDHHWTINSSSFVGFFPTSYPRYFHNFYLTYKNKKISTALLLDVGYQKHTWYSYGIAIKYTLQKHLAICTRFEQYYDPHNALLKYLPFSCNAINFSLGCNFNFLKYFQFKTEYRYFSATALLFPKNDIPYQSSTQAIIFNTLIFHL
ncbi:MAG: porin [Bacteroidia bacterium]|nr:porin [Bacteroidia bacterium]